MDPHIRAQELIRCDLCKTEMVRVHCDTCHVKLCNACIGEHMASKESEEKHEIIRFIFRKSIPLYPRCTHHDKERCEMYCNQCDMPVCITCISSDKHSGHHFLKNLEILDERKEKVIKEQNELNDILLVYLTYQKTASEVEHMIKQIEKACGDLSIAITQHGEKWHREIDKVVQKLTVIVDVMKNRQLQTLQSQLDEINEKISEIRNEINVIDDVMGSKDISELFGITLNVDKYRKLPQKFVPSFPSFTPGTEVEELCRLFGTISPEKHYYSIKKGERSSEAGFSSPVKQLLDEPEIINTMYTEYGINLYNVACLSDEKIWTSGDEGIMKLFSVSQGSLLRTIETNTRHTSCINERNTFCINERNTSCIYDIAVTTHGYLVYTDPMTRTVNIVKNEDNKTVIRPPVRRWVPHNICSTSSGDLLVVINSNDNESSRVVRYSGSRVKQTIQFDEMNHPLYSSVNSSKCICENKNLDICVADCGANAVVVVSQAGKLRFSYTGQISAPWSQIFNPRGITTDSKSQILTADTNNHCVHILDQDGRFLSYIECGQSSPWGLCVDTNDNLFVAQWRNKEVTKIKYLQGN